MLLENNAGIPMKVNQNNKFMKSLTTLLLLFTCLTAHAKLCEVNKTDEFDFTYTIKDKIIDFSIKRKDGQAFIVYEDTYLDYPFHLSFSYEDKTPPILGKVKRRPFIAIRIDSHIKPKDLESLLLEDNNIYSSLLGPASIDINLFPIEEKNLHKTMNYSKKIDLKDFIKFFKLSTPWHKQFGQQKILFKVKLIHDSEMKECSSFTIHPITVNMGSFVEFIEQLINDTFNPPKIKIPPN